MILNRDLSINRKLTLIIVSVASIVLLMACAAFVVYERIDFKKRMVRNIEVIAGMAGANCSAALIYDYASDAQETLQTLRAEQCISHAIVYTRDGEIFASYHREGAGPEFLPPEILDRNHRFDGDYLDLFRPIAVDNEIIGTTYIRADLTEMHARVKRYVGIVVLFLIVASFLAFLMATKLKRVISTPILHLAHVAKVVSENKDYSVRAEKHVHDEIGYLIDSFNEMLVQIQSRDTELQEAHEILEHNAEKLSSELAERKRAEEALEFMRFSVEHAAVAAFHTGNDGRFVYVNEAACNLLDYSREELLSMTVSDINPRLPEEAWPDYWKRIKKRSSFTTESVLRTKAGKFFPVEITVNYLEFGGKGYNCAFARDLTERKQAQEEQQELREKLERAERMESLGVLAGGVAHDLNNILGPLVGYPELILMKLPEDSPIRKQVQRVSNAARDAADVVQDLLTLARRGRYEMVPTSVNRIIETYIDSPSFAKLIERHPDVIVKLNLDTSISKIRGSSPHLSKVFMNLVVNAFDAMTEGGEVTIETSQQYLETLLNGYDEVEHTTYVLLRVRDTGIGIDPKDMSRIFEPYYSKKKMGSSGSGLGLSVVYGVIKDHNGYYDIISTPGQGAEFILYFPVAEDTVEEEPDATMSIGGHETILVVDDAEEQRTMASELLSSLGYNAQTADHGREAVRYLKDHRVDLVVLDMIMEKDFDGLDTYREITKLHPGQKVVIVSGYSATDRVQEMQRLGAGQYLKKPYSREAIGLAVRKELDKKTISATTP